MPHYLKTPFDREVAARTSLEPDPDWLPNDAIITAVKQGDDLPLPRPLTQPLARPLAPLQLVPQAKPARHWWGLGADCCYIVIEAGMFLMACWVMAMGLPLMFLLLLTGGQLDKGLVFLGSLFGAFVGATAERQYAFASDAAWVLVALATMVAAWRLPRFLDEVSHGLKTPGQMS